MIDVELSLVICTYNRAELLARLLDSLAKQNAASDRYEILIVDNNSSDDTKKVAHKYCQVQNDVRYLLEKRQGLSHARNRGVLEARGNYVGFVDDECLLDNDWISKALEIIQVYQPALFGGPYKAYYEQKPDWVKPSYWSTYPQMGLSARWLGNDEYLSGGNFFVSRSMLNDVGGFSPEFGMRGESILYGEETELQQRIRKQYPERHFYYDPSLCVEHLVRDEKLSLRWQVISCFNSGLSFAHVSKMHRLRKKHISVIIKSFLLVLPVSFYVLLSSFVLVFVRDRKKYPHFKNYWFEVALNRIATLGRLVGECF